MIMSRVPKLYVIADYAGQSRIDWITRVQKIAAGLLAGSALQLRLKGIDSAARNLLIQRAKQEALNDLNLNEVMCLLNGDEAEASRWQFSGVHWPDAFIPSVSCAPSVPNVRAASVHSVDGVSRAARANADFVVFGPVFNPGCKSGSGRGLSALEQIVRTSPIPVLAIGGVTPARVSDCLAAGAVGVATLSAVMTATNPTSVIEQYVCALGL